MRVFTLFDSCSRTNRPTNQRTDGGTDKASYRVACPQLKSVSTTESQNGWNIEIGQCTTSDGQSTDCMLSEKWLTRPDTRQDSRGWLGRSSNAKKKEKKMLAFKN